MGKFSKTDRESQHRFNLYQNVYTRATALTNLNPKTEDTFIKYKQFVYFISKRLKNLLIYDLLIVSSSALNINMYR